MDGIIKRWVNDELHSILGYSEPTITNFIVSLAKNTKSVDAFLNRLKSFDEGLAGNQKIRPFAQQLLGKFSQPAKPTASTLPQVSAQQKRLKELELANASLHALSSASDDDEDDIPIKSISKSKKDDKKSSKNLRKRKESSSEEDEVVIPQKNRNTRQTFDNDSDGDIDKMDAEDDQDARERDQFSTRLRENDKKKTRQIVSKSEAKAAAEAAKRLNIADKDDKTLIKSARYASRQQYLGKRTADKQYELERLVADEEVMFDESELTAKEKADRKYRKEVLQYVNEYNKAGDIIKKQRYHVPDATTKSIPTEYVEEEEIPGGDGRRWEDERLTAAVFKAGARDRIVSFLKIKIDFITINFRKKILLMN
jgi:pre-mRNA-splicing factor ATP-dependent RNA helicase DHX16